MLLETSAAANALPQDLQAISTSAAWYLRYSLYHFWPESILVIGFLLAIVIDLLERRTSRHHITAIFSIVTLCAAGIAALQQWTPFVPKQPWAGGMPVFPYSQSLFAPNVQHGAVLDGYGMAVVDNFAVFFKLLVVVAGVLVLLMSMT